MKRKTDAFSSKIGKNAVVLVVAGIICKLLGALFRISLTNLIGIQNIGVFQLIMSLYAFALILTSGGVTTSLSKLISSARATKDNQKIQAYLRRATFTSLVVGVCIGVTFLIFSKLLCSVQKIPPNPSYCLFIILLPLGAISAVLRGYFQGYENMKPTAISQVIEQVFKFALGLFFAYMFGPNAVFGAFLGITLSEAVCALYLFLIYSKKHDFSKPVLDLQNEQKEFDRTNLLLLGATIVLPLSNALDSVFIIPRLVRAGLSSATATQLFGLQSGIVGTLLNLPLVLSVSVATTLLPNFSYLISKGTKIRFLVERGLKILILILLPSVFGIVAVTMPLFSLLYKSLPAEFYSVGQNLMLYGGISTIFAGLMQYFLMVLQAFSKFRFCLLATLVGGIVKVATTFTLSAISSINIFALVVGNLLMCSIVCIISLYKLKKLVGFSFSLSEIFTLAFSTTAMYFLVKTFVDSGYFSPLPTLFCAAALGVVSYSVFSVPYFIKILNKKSFQEKKI